jgi:hypothetical protein
MKQNPFSVGNYRSAFNSIRCLLYNQSFYYLFLQELAVGSCPHPDESNPPLPQDLFYIHFSSPSIHICSEWSLIYILSYHILHLFRSTYTAARCHGVEVYLHEINTHIRGLNTYSPWNTTFDVTALRKTLTQNFAWELQQRHSRSTLLSRLRDKTARNLQANRIVPPEENSLSSYYRKDSIEIGRDNGVLDIK